MRIAVIHSFYRAKVPSGENRVVERQVAALEDAGHTVLLFRAETDALRSPLYKVRTAYNVATGGGVDPSEELERFKPDIVHIHNLFPNISTHWLQRWRGPFVVSLHNYRAFCSNGTLYRDGKICTDCVGGSNKPAVVHGCYRGSRMATIPVALSRSRTQRDLLERASAVITTSELSDEIIKASAGFDLLTTLIPNFVDSPSEPPQAPSEPRTWLTMGRFTDEKGFVELARDWPVHEHLIVDGFGPNLNRLLTTAHGKPITIQSTEDRNNLRRIVEKSFGLIFPSRWFDVDPQVVAEGMSAGLPVVAFHTNAAARIVEKRGAGAVYKCAGSLLEALNEVKANRRAMSQAAFNTFLEQRTKETWIDSVERLYHKLVVSQLT